MVTKNTKLTGQIWEWVTVVGTAALIVFVVRSFIFGMYHVPTGSGEPNLLVGDRIWGNKLVYQFGHKPKRGELIIFSNPRFNYSSSSVSAFWQKNIGLNFSKIGLPEGPDAWVKRVVAIPGDTIEGRVESGKTVIYLNGEPLDEAYINPYPLIRLTKKTGLIDLDIIGPLSIPRVLRQNSKYVWYSLDPDKNLDDQPFYIMYGDEIRYKPKTRQRWLRRPGFPTHQHGKVVDAFGPVRIPQGKYWVMGDSRRNSSDSRLWGLLDESLILGRASFVLYSIDSEEPFWFLELLKSPIAFWTKRVRWERVLKGIS